MKYPTAKCSTGDWHAAVVYFDQHKATDVVPACNVDGWVPPDFDRQKVYDIFWAPPPTGNKERGETLPEYKKRVSKIPHFENGTTSNSPGFWKGQILEVAGSELELEHFLEARRLRVPSEKVLKNSVSSASSTSITKALCFGKNKKRKQCSDSLSTKKRREKEIFSDSSSNEDLGVISATVHKEQMNALKQKYNISKEKIKRLEAQNESLKNLYDQLIAKLVNGDYRPKCGCFAVTTSNTIQPDPAIVDPKLQPCPSIDQPPTTHTLCAQPTETAPNVAVASNPVIAAELLAESNEPAEVPDETVNEDMVMLAPNIYIDKRADVPEFRAYVANPGSLYGSEGDPQFIRKAADKMWTDAVLKERSVTGKLTNIEKKKNPDAVPKPALEDYKIRAILEALRARVLKEQAAPPPPGRDKDATPFDKRVTPQIVKYYIGRAIHNAKRRKV